MPLKRKRSSVANIASAVNRPTISHETPILSPRPAVNRAPPNRQASRRGKIDTNPDHNEDIVDGKTALRASPDADEKGESLDVQKVAQEPRRTSAKTNGVKEEGDDSPLSDLETPALPSLQKQKKSPTKSSVAAKKGSDEIKAFKAEQAAKKAAATKIKKEDDGDEWEKRVDPDGDEDGPTDDIDTIKNEAARPPPVNSDYLPLPWKGRLGYACLNTYLRFSNPPVFTSRTCRIASIVEHRHPLKDPSQPEHATKNRPDKSQPASIERGQRYVEELCLANVRDLPKMFKWNDKYGISFMRLSSEMFPFASHAEYGYKLAPFASEALAEAGKAATELGHRVSTHPGQFTQLGSPRVEVIANAVRDLDYHDEMLSLLKLPEQEDRNAVMILHLGGTFGDKAATLDRFRENYKTLSPSVKMRIVLENDDVSWSVYDLLPICEELSIPLCLDFHHHNIIFDSSQLREGTLDIMSLYPRIKATWDRKNIRQKMHYSEGCPEAITGRQRRKHNPRPILLPPCANDMDLMIEAKDKEQAVFELMRTFKLPGWDTFNNIIPYERRKKLIEAEIEEFGKELSDEEEVTKEPVPEEEVGMGGKENRVYWPPGMEEWLRPKKREIKKKGSEDEEAIFRNPTPGNFAARKAITARNKAPLSDEIKEKLKDATSVADVQGILEDVKAASFAEAAVVDEDAEPVSKKAKPTSAKNTPAKKAAPGKKVKDTPTPSVSNVDDEDEDDDLSMPDLSADDENGTKKKTRAAAPARQSGRARGKRTNYAEADGDIHEE
ncbi:UV-damage endonuclease [Lachnellula subtilissima]|uniref:UV-damage endonuclease n=1 Tax=Lachnellula subtilissima TaxID=602034 RepID=A0A8H8U8D7_9HELO|nr:UV-damage endonuclease [Lachnellula subtilissima]